ncbi:MAG: molybdenum cofactor guanylyltransferase [Acidimicrobiales bacterium]
MSISLHEAGRSRTSGILLTGGESRRFGSPKGLVAIGEGTLAHRTAIIMERVCDMVIEVGAGISGAAKKMSDEPRQGPLNALVRAWASLPVSDQDSWILGLACDLPLVDVKVLQTLLCYEPPLSVVPLVDGHPQYLCARWAPERLDKFEHAVLAGERSFARALAGAEDVAYVPAGLLLDPGSRLDPNGNLDSGGADVFGGVHDTGRKGITVGDHNSSVKTGAGDVRNHDGNRHFRGTVISSSACQSAGNSAVLADLMLSDFDTPDQLDQLQLSGLWPARNHAASVTSAVTSESEL